jgi:hypothetical protein
LPPLTKGENRKMQINKKLYATLIISILTISAIMAAIPMASAEITTDPTLYEPGTTTPLTSGAVGSKVEVVGATGAGDADAFATVKVYWDSLMGTVLGTVSADNNGEYAINVTIPASVAGPHWIIVNDGETESGGAQFTVEPALSVSPDYALPGDTVTVSGDGYAAESDITLFLNQTTDPTISFVITVPAITTDDNGSFDASVVVPAVDYADFDVYDVNATDEDSNTAIAQLDIDYYINCLPPAGPTGITTTISGRIASGVAYTITFNAASIATGTTASDGSYSVAYPIPGVLSPAAYPVTITWETVNTRSTTFTVTPPPTISLGALNGVAGAVVTITGSGFSGYANISLYFGTTVVNSTAMDPNFGHTSLFGALPSGLTFVVPSLTPGVYTVSVVDQYGATSAAGVYFTIDPTPATTIALRSTTYYPMDIPSFNIMTTEISLGIITVSIFDPAGSLWWRTDDWSLTTSDDGTYKTVIFQDQAADAYNQMKIVFPADAPLGTWNWTITYTPTSTGMLTKATGLFTVMAREGMQDVLDEIADLKTDLEATITDVVTDSEGDLTAVINTKTGQITTKLDALGPQLQGIEDMGIIIATDVGEIKVAIADLDLGTMGVDITAIKGDVATIKTNLGTVSTSVSTLDAKVVALSGDVATVNTALGTLEGKVTAVDGKVATVNTSVGTLQADVSDILAKPDVDMTPVWIAVVLSLIAAIAAIFAVVTIRQKIAG